MKAELNESGVLTVTPETPTEAYAMKQWINYNYIAMRDEQRMENGCWRGSSLIVKGACDANPN